MTFHVQPFPFEEIRQSDGNYFDTWAQAKAAGYDDNQIWSVVGGDDDIFTYGPPYHYVNVVGFIATNERHDGDTYYEEHF